MLSWQGKFKTDHGGNDMLELNVSLFGVIVTVLLALLALAYGYGVLTQKVKSNRYDINKIANEFKDYQRENKNDHQAINLKLDTIIRNGQKG